MIAALQAYGALSSPSPVPGQLAALSRILTGSGPGRAASLPADLPERWLSVLASGPRGTKEAREATRERAGGAAVAVALPDLDGTRRDGHWHATLVESWSQVDGGITIQMAVLPPLRQSVSRIEIFAAGPTAEVHVTLPLH